MNSIFTKAEPININEEFESFHAFALDAGIPIFNEGPIKINFYAQLAALLGKTENPESKKRRCWIWFDSIGFGCQIGSSKT